MSLDYNSWQKSIRTQPAGSFTYPYNLISHAPNSVDAGEAIGLTLTAADSKITSLSLYHRTTGNVVSVQNQAELKTVNLPFLGAVGANLLVKTNAALTSINAPNLALPTFGNSGTGSSLDFSGNALSATNVDALFNRLALSLSSGVAYYCKIDTSGGTSAAPTAASSLARSSLYLGATAAHITITTN